MFHCPIHCWSIDLPEMSWITFGLRTPSLRTYAYFLDIYTDLIHIRKRLVLSNATNKRTCHDKFLDRTYQQFGAVGHFGSPWLRNAAPPVNARIDCRLLSIWMEFRYWLTARARNAIMPFVALSPVSISDGFITFHSADVVAPARISSHSTLRTL